MSPKFGVSQLSAITLLLSSAFAATPSASTTAACKAMEAAVPGEVVYEGSSPYKAETDLYYNAGNSLFKPACIFQPRSKESTSKGVVVLGKYPDVNFVVKSGGHDPNPGHSSIDGGILVAMSQLNGTVNDAANKVAYVKPGGHWQNVIAPLDKEGVTVVGGRLGAVGLGGYLTQGGVSYLSAQYGLAADNVVAYETVLANGSIVSISMDNHPDIMRAMRGSGNQFGIVTQFTLRTHPIGKVWGGIREFDESQRDELYAGIHDFIKNNADNPKAAVIFTASPAAKSTTFATFFFYDGETVPASAFGKLGQVKPKHDLTKVRSYTSMIGIVPSPKVFTGASSVGLKISSSFRSVTLPYIEDFPEWYKQIEYTYRNISNSYNMGALGPHCTIAFQPFSRAIGVQSAKNGGNAMGLTTGDKDRFVLEMNQLWVGEKYNADGIAIGQKTVAALHAQHKAQAAVTKETLETYLPFFMNDAADDEMVVDSYAGIDQYRVLAKEMDPDGLWQRAGGSAGWKY